MAAWTTVVLGGARSGKSALAERLAGSFGQPVSYLATARPPDPHDRDWSQRIEAHRRRRPPTWTTVEIAAGEDGHGDLPAAMLAVTGVALVDSLGTWVAAAPGMAVDIEALCQALAHRQRRNLFTVVVSEEVGLGVHPSTPAGLQFRDVLGTVNREVAEVADEVMLAVAGRALALRRVDEVIGSSDGEGRR